jgi:hypothetical protein
MRDMFMGGVYLRGVVGGVGVLQMIDSKRISRILLVSDFGSILRPSFVIKFWIQFPRIYSRYVTQISDEMLK